MKDSLDILYTGDFVEHHGVKGMKWGIRKQRYTGESCTNRLSEIKDKHKSEISNNRKVKRFDEYAHKYWNTEKPSKHKTKKYNKLRSKAEKVEFKLNGKYERQEQKLFKKAKNTVSKEDLKRLDNAKKEFSKIWRDYGWVTSTRNENGNLIHLTKEDRAKYEKARQNVIDTMNTVTMSIVKDSSKKGWGAMQVTNYLLNEKDNSKNDRYGLNYAFDWDIEKDKLKKWKQPSK